MKLHEITSQLTSQQIKWLDKVINGEWEYKNGVVDVEGNVYASGGDLSTLPVQFGYVSGYFNLSYNRLTSLKGSPREVGGEFWVSHNKLTSLKGSPREVGEDFYISYNELTSLRGAPKEVGENFYVRYNKFKSEPDHSFIKIGGKFVWK